MYISTVIRVCVCVVYIHCSKVYWEEIKVPITYTVDLDYYEGSVLVPEPTNT